MDAAGTVARHEMTVKVSANDLIGPQSQLYLRRTVDRVTEGQPPVGRQVVWMEQVFQSEGLQLAHPFTDDRCCFRPETCGGICHDPVAC